MATVSVNERLIKAQVGLGVGEQRLRTPDYASRTPYARVLVIDDFEGVHLSFKLALEDLPVRLLHANDGEEGVEMAAHADADLIFLDLKMRGLDGVDTLGQLRRKLPDTPVVILTAFAPEYRSRLKDAGRAGDYFELLHKPLELSEIRMVTGVATGAFRPRWMRGLGTTQVEARA